MLEPLWGIPPADTGMCSCTIWAKHDIILFRVALGFLLLIVYPFVCSGRHELYANGAAQGNAFSGAIALYRAKDGVRGNQAIGQSVWTDAATYDIMGGSF